MLEEKLTFLRAQAGVLSMNLHTTGDMVASDVVFAMQRDLEAVTMLFEAFKARQPSVGPGDVETIKDNTREAQELLDRASGLLTGVSVHAGDVIA